MPSSQVTIHASEAGMDPITFRASAVVSTVGTRVGFLARMAPMGRPSSYLTPSRERNSQASRRVLGRGAMVHIDRRSCDDHHTRVGCVPGDGLEDTRT